MGAQTTYDPTWTLREARARYFADNRFGDDGGYGASWVTLAKLGPLKLGFPNTAARVKAVRYHDLHHLATGYATDFLGEAEIAAWELASGCKDMRAAWVLNTMALPFGLWRHRDRLETAFARGARSRNLYGEPFTESLLDETLGQVRDRLGVDDTGDAPLTTEERSELRRFLVAGVLAQLAVLAVLAGILVGVALAVAWGPWA